MALSRGRLRDRDGQLQPRDRLDRLRHLRPALLRAADPRGRARDRARRAGRPGRSRASSASSAARPRSASPRGSRTTACRSSAPRPAAIHLAEERGAFGRVLAEAGLPAPKHGMATSYAEAQAIAAEIGYPVLVRPSYVLGGRGMEIVYGDDAARGLHRAGDPGQPRAPGAGRPVHRRRGRDRRRRALRRRGAVPRRGDGAHRGGRHPLRRLLVRAAADHAGRVGDPADPRGDRGDRARRRGPGAAEHPVRAGADILYVLEANPRASRTVPFVSKATATPLAKAAARIMLGETVAELRAAGAAARDRVTAARCRPTSRSRSRRR